MHVIRHQNTNMQARFKLNCQLEVKTVSLSKVMTIPLLKIRVQTRLSYLSFQSHWLSSAVSPWDSSLLTWFSKQEAQPSVLRLRSLELMDSNSKSHQSIELISSTAVSTNQSQPIDLQSIFNTNYKMRRISKPDLKDEFPIKFCNKILRMENPISKLFSKYETCFVT